ncbi:MAG: 6-bladed beta-propeller [Nitrosopumilaceae archaeon]|nr:6-bladed beta-propeller [Nitrosopumilaceae archaeon]
MSKVIVAIFAISAILLTSSISYSSALSEYDKLYEWGSFGIAKPGQFSYPQFIEVDGFGEIYVTDLGNKRVQKFTHDGQYLLEWGGSGSADGQFHYPSGITTDDEFVYVADRDLNRIQKFDLQGNYVTQWGEKGKSNGMLFMPNGISVYDSFLYIADTGNNRIQKFTTNGEFVFSFGSSGIGPGQFLTVIDVDVDLDGNVYVTDKGNKKIEIFDSDGILIESLSFTGTNYDFIPEGIEVDDSGSFFVINSFDDNVLYLSKDSSLHLDIFAQKGPLESDFTMPTDIALGKYGELHVTDSFNHSIQTFETPNYVTPPKTNEIKPIEIIEEIKDDTPPVIITPDDMFVDATGIYTPVDFGEATATDENGIKAILNNAPEEFPLGISKITWIAFDNTGNTVEGYQFVTVYACGQSHSNFNRILGTSGDDVLIGTDDPDLIFGLDGNDLIDGKASHDCIFGGNGNDVVYGSEGHDSIRGGFGDDVLKGQLGLDVIYGDMGFDIIDGGEDRDSCYDTDTSNTIMINCE